MTYLASADLLAVRSLTAEHAFSLNHRTDLPPRRRTFDQEQEGSRARIFTSKQCLKSAPKPSPSTSGTIRTDSGRRTTDRLEGGGSERATTSTGVLPAPKGKHHRPEPEPLAEAPGYTVIDLRHRRVRWQYTPTNSQGHQHEHGYGMLIDLDAYRTHALARLRPTTPPRTQPPQPTGHLRRRSTRVRGYTRDLAPDERAEFATLRNTIRRYLDRKPATAQTEQQKRWPA